LAAETEYTTPVFASMHVVTVTHFVQRRPILFLLLAPLAFLLFLLATRDNFQRPCRVETIQLAVLVNGAPVGLPLPEIIETPPHARMAITAETLRSPPRCAGDFAIDWLILPQHPLPSPIKTESSGARSTLELITGNEAADAVITINVRDAAGVAQKRATLVLRTMPER
jgi:hypothetical protein